MQLVLSNNRVIAHGENFLAMGGVVINTETETRYEKATIAECEGCPSDINEVGYEYHAGVFVPCAPYGKGNGNLAVLCDNDCKAIKDSGVSLNKVAQFQLLWENASPNSEFEAQTITLASDDWSFLLCESTEGTNIITSESKALFQAKPVSSKLEIRTREIEEITTTTIKFATGDLHIISTSGSLSHNIGANYIKPLKIYGVKI